MESESMKNLKEESKSEDVKDLQDCYQKVDNKKGPPPTKAEYNKAFSAITTLSNENKLITVKSEDGKTETTMSPNSYLKKILSTGEGKNAFMKYSKENRAQLDLFVAKNLGQIAKMSPDATLELGSEYTSAKKDSKKIPAFMEKLNNSANIATRSQASIEAFPDADPSLSKEVPTESYTAPQTMWSGDDVTDEMSELKNEQQSLNRDILQKSKEIFTIDGKGGDSSTAKHELGELKKTTGSQKEKLLGIIEKQLVKEESILKELESSESSPPSEELTTQSLKVAGIIAKKTFIEEDGNTMKAQDKAAKLVVDSEKKPVIVQAEAILKKEIAVGDQNRGLNEFYTTEKTFSEQLGKMSETSYDIKGGGKGTLLDALISNGAITQSEKAILENGLSDLEESTKQFVNVLKDSHESSDSDISKRNNSLVDAFSAPKFDKHFRNMSVASAGATEGTAIINRLEEKGKAKGGENIQKLLDQFEKGNEGKSYRSTYSVPFQRGMRYPDLLQAAAKPTDKISEGEGSSIKSAETRVRGLNIANNKLADQYQ